jgi:hypothetical protein
MDPIEYVKGKGRFIAFENLPSTLRELCFDVDNDEFREIFGLHKRYEWHF